MIQDDFVIDLEDNFNAEHQQLVNFLRSITKINEKTLGKIKFNLKSYIKSKDNSNYIKGFIEYALKIRPNSEKILSNLLLDLGFWKKNGAERNVFESREYEESIRKDDVKTFKSIINKKTFNPKEKVFVHKRDPIFNVSNDNNVTYLQHIAFSGAYNCFNYAIDQDIFDKTNLSRYAVAGGNLKIIQKLKERGESFDNCFKVAVKFHYNDLWEQELSEYQKDNVYLSETQQFYNDEAFLYIYKNSSSVRKNLITNSKIEALKRGNLNMVKYLKVSIDEKYFGESPLHIATKYHHLDIIKYFLAIDKTFFNEPDYSGITSLHIAADKCYADILELFYKEYNAKIESIDGEAIVYAVYKGNIKLIDNLLFTWEGKKHKKIEVSLFSIASRRGDIDIFKLIIKYFKNEFDEEEVNKSLKIAVENCNLDIIKYLIDDWNADSSNISQKYVYNATKKGNYEAVKYLIEKCKVKLGKDVYSKNLLIIATEYFANENYMNIIEYLVEKCKINLYGTNDENKTALHIAIEKTNFKLVKYFVNKCHMSLNKEDIYGLTPLDIARNMGDLKIISFLTDALNKDKYLSDEQIKMRKAVEEGDLNLFIKIFNKRKETFLPPEYLIIAAEKENLDLMEFLFDECDFDVETEDSYGRTPLYISAEKGNLANIKYLIECKDADFETECIARKTPLHIAAEKGHLDVVKYLLDIKATRNRQDKYYQTPFSLAIEAPRSNKEMIKYLSEKCPESITEIDFFERNLLHIAAKKDDIEFLEFIKSLLNSASPSTSNLEKGDYRENLQFAMQSKKEI